MRRKVPSLLIFIVLLFSFAIPAYANDYARVANLGVSIQGGYFSAANTTLSGGFSSTNTCNFVVKTQWLGFGSGSTSAGWIEVGRVNGATENPSGAYTCGTTKVSNADGYYTAAQSSAGVYEEYLVTGFSTSGTHNYQIQYTSGTNWVAYVDYTSVHTYSRTETTATRHRVGFETNNTSATWTSGNTSTAIQTLGTGGSWSNWTTGTREDYSTGYNSLLWYANFGTSGGTTNYSTATYTR
ncbi:hypothetical protein [Cohnella fermenti]|uniref:Uncharacterized protein n=1 Tax=Cohnella fermenti TaxID=2565925 RepID=A0A4S4BGS9_9BACL|nr:hypothetical protein [Cohnella fermenti]THF73050.1 hypothetical protein E6C55_30905 [Cohnella fermenti]